MKIINVGLFQKLFEPIAHQVCCDDSPTKVLYDHCQFDDLDLHSRSQVRLKLDYFLIRNISDSINNIQTWHDGRFMDAVYVHAPFDDPDIDARSQWVGKGKQSALHLIISIDIATTV